MSNRVIVPLSPADFETICYLADKQNMPRGRVLAETIQGAMPALTRIVKLMKKCDKAVGQERQDLLQAFDEAEKYLLDGLTIMGKSPLTDIGVLGGRGARSAECVTRPSDPPILTGGFTLPKSEASS